MIFWIGDLNYRVQTSHEMTFEVIKAHADSFQTQTLLKHDQLLNEMKKKNVFCDFLEMPIDFKPTYKYIPGTNDLDSRYVDRIQGIKRGFIIAAYHSQLTMWRIVKFSRTFIATCIFSNLLGN